MSDEFQQADLFGNQAANDECLQENDVEPAGALEHATSQLDSLTSTETATVEPIGETQRDLVFAQTTRFCHLAERLYRLRLPDLRVDFDLSGATAGLFEVHGEAVRVRYNPWIFAKYFQDSLDNTVPHEVAHFVVHQRYRRRVKPHGPQWRQVMADFGADPAVTFHYDLSGIPTRRQRSHRYLCGCREHELSTTRHNRVQRGEASYSCVRCAGSLRYAPRVTP